MLIKERSMTFYGKNKEGSKDLAASKMLGVAELAIE